MAGSAGIMAGQAFVRLFLKDDMAAALAKTMKNAGTAMADFGAGAMKVGAGVTAGGAAILAPIIAGVAAFTRMGSGAVDAAARTGLSVEALSELGFSAQQTGADMGDVEIGIKKMSSGIQDLATGQKAAVENFQRLGLSMEDLQGLSPEDQFALVGKRIAAIQDPTMRAAAAVDMFGRSGTKMLPMLADLDGLRAKARALGIVISTEDAKAADDLGDTFDMLKSQAMAALFGIGKAVAGPLQEFATAATKIGATVLTWIANNGELIRTVAKIGLALTAAGGVITGFGAAVFGIGKALVVLAPFPSTLLTILTPTKMLGLAFSAIALTVKTLAAAVMFLVSPFAIINAVILAGVGYWLLFTESGQRAISSIKGAVLSIIDAFAPMVATLSDTFSGIIDAVKSGDLATAGGIAMAG